MIKILETAQKNELRILIEAIKDILEKNFEKKLLGLGIQRDNPVLIQLSDLVDYQLLESESAKKEFEQFRLLIWETINQDSKVLSNWGEAYYWYLDKMVYTFFNRIFAIRIMEELGLLSESTIVPQSDLGNRSARMRKIQERFFDKTEEEWNILVLKDVFTEISEDIKIIFDETELYMKIWPNGEVIESIISKLNKLDPAIYHAEDCIGWFYHYYVLKFRKGHKTMSAHGTKAPKNPYYLSILNTVYTPRWMVQVLVDNSLGHWWQDLHPDSKIFLESPYFIKKVPVKIESTAKELEELKILDPACGSGNFLMYAFGKLIEMYRESNPVLSYSEIIKNILERNLYGIDINRRPAQLSALALYIMAKRTLKEHALSEFAKFKMPRINIICCDIRTPSDKNKILLLQKIKDDRIKKIIKDVVTQFDNADELGTLINIRELQDEIDKLRKTTLESFFGDKKNNRIDLPKIIDEQIFNNSEQNIGLEIFGHQTQKALTLAQALMEKYDIIISNPPFGLIIDSTKEKIKVSYPNSYADLVSAFVDQSLRLLKKNGYIAMVTDFSFLHLPKFEKFRENVLLTKSYIQFLFMIGYGSLPDAGNRPVLFILNNIEQKLIGKTDGLYRNINYDLNKSFSNEFYAEQFITDRMKLNKSNYEDKLPENWNLINQKDFLNLPRCVIDLNIAEKFKPLIEFFTKYPRLDISQHSKTDKERLPKTHVARSYAGIQTGKNDVFVRYWFEVNPGNIRIAEYIDSISDLPNNNEQPFVPFSKGGGDIRYYLSNPFILWWNKGTIEVMENYDSVIRNPSLFGNAHITWSLVSGKPRGRFNIAQRNLGSDSASVNIKILHKDLDKYGLLAYLNSKLICFLVRLQTKDRKWQPGNIARIPIPLDFLIKNNGKLSFLSKESFELRRDWDTGYPMSPLFAGSLIDKVIEGNPTIKNHSISKTGHPFCQEYSPCNSETAEKIKNIKVAHHDTTIKLLLELVEKRFDLLTRRLDEIDEEINQILYGLIDNETANALEDYYNTYIGKLIYKPERDIWLKDFLMANLIEIVKNTRSGIIPLNTYKDDEIGLYDSLIQELCRKFKRDITTITPILKELKENLGENLKNWIEKEFFSYHCHQFGGRPIIWQFTSSSNSNSESAIVIFLNYYKLDENTLPRIRVDYIQPILKLYEHRKDAGVLREDEIYKIDELYEFQKSILALENGYESIPNPNSLTGSNAQKGQGFDKTWEWVFSEAGKIIKGGYKPDHFKGVLINLIPLCLDIPVNKKDAFNTRWRSLCPKGTIKDILKKIDALDQLKNEPATGETEISEDMNEERLDEENEEAE